jgi:DNA-binding winged helix-turn-helix (wHTH) protein
MSIYRFGPFEARTHVRELYRSGTKVHLRGQPFQLLQALLSHPGEVVTRDQMRAELWPSDTFVDFEHGINASLRKLRQALGDSAIKPMYIETLPGVGYRFIAPFETVEEAPVKESESQAEEPSVSNGMEEAGDGAQEPGSARRPWSSFAPAAVVVVLLGLFLLVPKWNRRVVQGATASPTEAQAALSSGQNAPDALVDGSLRSAAPVHQGLSRIQGRVWVVSVAEASHVAFPPPNRTPDATFTTRGIAYMGWDPDNCYTLATFLAQCSNRGLELQFSGIPNPNLGGAAAGPDTTMSGRTWAVLIEFTGTANLAKGQEITILHDDGAALKIDGQTIPGFDPLVTAPVAESVRFAGLSGVHSFDLLYANAAGPGAWLLFYPALY